MQSSRVIVKYIMPTFLRWVYRMSVYTPAATDRNKLGVAGYLRDYPSPAYLVTFMRRKYSFYTTDAASKVEQVKDEGYHPSNPNGKASMDIQYAEAMTYPTPHIFYSTSRGYLGTDDWFISWLNYILRQRSISQTISTSYAINEGICNTYVQPVCTARCAWGQRPLREW